MAIIGVYLYHNLRVMLRHIRNSLSAENVSFELLLFFFGAFAIGKLKGTTGVHFIFLAGLLPLLYSERLNKLHKFINVRPLTIWQKWVLTLCVPVCSMHGVLLIVGLLFFANKGSGISGFSLLWVLVAIHAYTLVLLVKINLKKLLLKPFFSFMTIFVLALFAWTLLKSHHQEVVLFPQMFVTHGLLIAHLRRPREFLQGGGPITLQRLRTQRIPIRNYFTLSFYRFMNTMEFWVLFVFSIFAWFYFFGGDPPKKDSAFILGVFQVGMLSLLANNLFGLEQKGFMRTWFFPVSGARLLWTKVGALGCCFLLAYLPLLLGQWINFGWAVGLATTLTHLEIGMLLVTQGLWSSVERSIQRGVLPSAFGQFGGIRFILFNYFVILLVPGFTALNLFRRDLFLWLYISIFSFPIIIMFLKWNIHRAGNNWDRLRDL